MGRPRRTPIGLKLAAVCFILVAVGLFVIPHDVAPRELFSEANPYSYDQRELAAFHQQYRRLMAHWHAAWAPLSLLIFGLKDTRIYFVIVMSAAPAIAIATADGILNIPPIYLRAARTLGTPAAMMPFRIIVPAALPAIVGEAKPAPLDKRLPRASSPRH